jgi:hypothetical protein
MAHFVQEESDPPDFRKAIGVSLEVLSQVMPVNFYFHSVLVHCQRSVHAFAHANSEVYSVLEVLVRALQVATT